MNTNIFNERQRFTQIWVWILIIGAALVITFTSKSMFTSILMALMILLFYSMNLKTNISNEGITYRYIPFHFSNHLIKWADIKEAYVREYKPMSEYGGWGLRYGRKGTAYNVKGNMGLQLILKDGKKILIGTQKAEELEQFLQTVN